MPGEAALVPMDGYHLDNAVLVERGLLPRKGAPQTFDVDGLARDLERHPRRRAARSSSRSSTATSTWRGPGRASIRPEHRVVWSRATTCCSTRRPGAGSRLLRPHALPLGRPDRSCAGGWSTAGWRTDWTLPPPLPAPRGTTCPTRSWWRPAGGRPISSGGTENRPSVSRKSDATSGDHLLNSRGSPRVTFGFVPKKPDLGKKPTVVSENFRRVSGHEHPPTLQWPERLW